MCRSSTCCGERRSPSGPTTARRAAGGAAGRRLAAGLPLACALIAAAAGAVVAAGAEDAARAPGADLAAARVAGEVGAAAEQVVDGAEDHSARRAAESAEPAPAWTGYDAGVDIVSAVVKTVATLGAFAALAYLLVKVVGPRMGPLGGRPDDLIQVHALKRLDPKTTLYLVEVGGRYALVSVSEQRVQALTATELDAAALAERTSAGRPAKSMASTEVAAALGVSGPRAFASLLRSGPQPTGASDGEQARSARAEA